MYEAKINYLGLCMLIRLILFVEYLSFLGGETQRPILSNYGRAKSAQDTSKSFVLYTTYKSSKIIISEEEIIDFCPLHEPSYSTAVSKDQGGIFEQRREIED